MNNREFLLKHKAKVQDTYPINHTAMIIDYLLTSPHLEAKLEWNPKFCPYDYIDNIDPKDMKLPVMWGMDAFDRLFVAIRTQLDDTPTLSVETFFQRYSGGKPWASGSKSSHYKKGYGMIRIVYSTLADKDIEAFQNFMNLLTKGSTNVERWNIAGTKSCKSQFTVI